MPNKRTKHTQRSTFLLHPKENSRNLKNKISHLIVNSPPSLFVLDSNKTALAALSPPQMDKAMNIKPPPPSSSSTSNSDQLLFTRTAALLHSVSPLPFSITLFPSISTSSSANTSKTTNPFRVQNTTNPSSISLAGTTTATGPLTSTSKPPTHSQDEKLLTLLRLRKTEEAWLAYTQSEHLPNHTCLSRLVCQLSYQNTNLGLTRAQAIIRRLRNERQLHRLDANSLGLLAVAAAKGGHILYATSIIRSMLKSGYLPHVKAWSAVISRLAATGDDGPAEAIKLFSSITGRVRRFADPTVVKDSRPDTAAYNAVFNACANRGDSRKFLQLFNEMPEFGCEPDVLTYNVMIKLCARADRKDLLVFVLERIIEKGIPVCMTTLQSLVAAYVGFGDLETAEKMVQAMRKSRTDLCKILRDSSMDNRTPSESDIFEAFLPNSVGPREQWDSSMDNRTPSESGIFEAFLPNSVGPRNSEPQELPKVFAPNTRMYTTLMKGYMKAGRVSDVVRMLEAMRHEEDRASHPDHVTYTTVISAFVKAGSMDRARQVLAEMTRIGVPANRITYNILLKGHCQQLQMDKAKELMQKMINDSTIEPDVVSYNILIDGCILVDDSAGALAYFNEMRARAIAPTKISYTTLMKAFASSSQPKLANKVFDEMLKDPRIKVDMVAWNMLVEGYSRMGQVEEAKNVIQSMKEKGFYPNVATYGSLANGIALARKPGEALLLWNEIKERCGMQKEGDISNSSSSLPPLKPDEGLLDTLADICVRAAFFRKALEIVACMEEHGIPPNKTKFTRICVEMHSRMFTSKHASRARQERRTERKRAAEAFKFWLGLPNSYYASEWHFDTATEGD